MRQPAKSVLKRKLVLHDGAILQFVVWELLEPLPGSATATSTGYSMAVTVKTLSGTTTNAAREITGITKTKKSVTSSGTWIRSIKTFLPTWNGTGERGINELSRICY